MGPARPTGEEVLDWGTARSTFLADGGVENSVADPVKLHGVKRRSILFDLPYWKVKFLTRVYLVLCPTIIYRCTKPLPMYLNIPRTWWLQYYKSNECCVHDCFAYCKE